MRSERRNEKGIPTHDDLDARGRHAHPTRTQTNTNTRTCKHKYTRRKRKRGYEIGREERARNGWEGEGSNSTKLRHYGAFVLTPLLSLLGGQSEMGIDAAERRTRNDEQSVRRRKEASFNGTPPQSTRSFPESHLTEIIRSDGGERNRRVWSSGLDRNPVIHLILIADKL